MPEPNIQLLPASRFTMEELTVAYNQTRVDYLVPMPMNAARLEAYVQTYDVSLDDSLVAVDGSQILGLAMLGVRADRTWITRLGVLPVRRRRGSGEAIMRGLLDATERMGKSRSILEVIEGNEPAHCLFLKLGFEELRGLLVLRRPPGNPPHTSHAGVTWLDESDGLSVLRQRMADAYYRPAWTNEIESLQKPGDLLGLSVELDNGGSGWLTFRRQKFLLSHFIFHTSQGSPVEVAGALLSHLYQRYPMLDTYVENLPTDDPHVPALAQMGFIEAFRRIEMERKTYR